MDKLIIYQLALEAIIGIHAHERTDKQPILVDLEIDYDSCIPAGTDKISDALDYSKIVECLQNFIKEKQFFLIETLANQIANYLLVEFNIKKLRLSLYKPKAIPIAEYAGLVIERKSPLH